MSNASSFALIRHPSEARVLLVREGSGWNLPSLSPKFENIAMVEGLTESLLREHAIEATVLRLAHRRTEAGKAFFRAYELETHSELPTDPSRYRWAATDEVDAIAPSQADLLDATSALLNPSHAHLRSPWAQPGWLEQASRWIRDRLSERKLETLAIEQVKVWQLCCVLRAKTRRGDFYFKVSASCFAAEAAITSDLSRKYPGRTPEVIACDPARRWFIAADLGGDDLASSDDVSKWKNVLEFYAGVQLSFVDRRDELAAMGCPDRTLPRLAEQLTSLLADREGLGGHQGLTEAEIDTLVGKERKIRSWIDELASMRIPPMFEHGDLHPWNVRVGRGGAHDFAIFDWSDGCLAHPFMFLAPFFYWFTSPKVTFPASVSAAREELLATYLNAFERYESGDRLKRAGELGFKLACLHQAVSYHQFINPSLEDKAEWRRAQTDWLKALLA